MGSRLFDGMRALVNVGRKICDRILQPVDSAGDALRLNAAQFRSTTVTGEAWSNWTTWPAWLPSEAKTKPAASE